uniref:dihydrofolate reductase n=1 Tax=Timema tahoe TaxID=61484 RepID=A0A7R9NXW7_9NEOP|nr:unnamed protein product [Timema tahoe]
MAMFNWNIIAAVCENMGIGRDGELPWMLKKELAYFSKMTKLTQEPTKQNAVVMGRKTWESIPQKNRPLAGRINIVLSRQIKSFGAGVVACPCLESAIDVLSHPPWDETIETVWVIGGSSVYQKVMESSLCHKIYLTRILENFKCDVFLPEIPKDFVKVK